MRIKLFNKGKLFRLIGISLILIMFVGAISVGNGFAEKSLSKMLSKQERKLLSSAIFEKDGVLYSYSEKTGKIKQLSDESTPKYLPQLSPSKENLAFAYASNMFGSELKLGILDMNNKKISDITIQSRYSDVIMDIQWINDRQLGVECHVNPSTSEYFIINIKDKSIQKTYAGSRFTVLPDGSVMYKGHIPHGWKSEVKETLYINDQQVYEAEATDISIGYPQVSTNNTKIAFIETNDNDPENNKLVICELDFRELSLNKKASVELTDNVHGRLLFDTTDNIYFVDEDYTYTVDEQTLTIKEAKTKKDKEYSDEWQEKLNAFDKALKNHFKNTEEERVKVEDVKWFSGQE